MSSSAPLSGTDFLAKPRKLVLQLIGLAAKNLPNVISKLEERDASRGCRSRRADELWGRSWHCRPAVPGCRLDLAAGAGVDEVNLQSEGACRFRYVSRSVVSAIGAFAGLTSTAMRTDLGTRSSAAPAAWR